MGCTTSSDQEGSTSQVRINESLPAIVNEILEELCIRLLNIFCCNYFRKKSKSHLGSVRKFESIYKKYSENGLALSYDIDAFATLLVNANYLSKSYLKLNRATLHEAYNLVDSYFDYVYQLTCQIQEEGFFIHLLENVFFSSLFISIKIHQLNKINRDTFLSEANLENKNEFYQNRFFYFYCLDSNKDMGMFSKKNQIILLFLFGLSQVETEEEKMLWLPLVEKIRSYHNLLVSALYCIFIFERHLATAVITYYPEIFAEASQKLLGQSPLRYSKYLNELAFEAEHSLINLSFNALSDDKEETNDFLLPPLVLSVISNQTTVLMQSAGRYSLFSAHSKKSLTNSSLLHCL